MNPQERSIMYEIIKCSQNTYKQINLLPFPCNIFAYLVNRLKG